MRLRHNKLDVLYKLCECFWINVCVKAERGEVLGEMFIVDISDLNIYDMQKWACIYSDAKKSIKKIMVG